MFRQKRIPTQEELVKQVILYYLNEIMNDLQANGYGNYQFNIKVSQTLLSGRFYQNYRIMGEKEDLLKRERMKQEFVYIVLIPAKVSDKYSGTVLASNTSVLFGARERIVYFLARLAAAVDAIQPQYEAGKHVR